MTRRRLLRLRQQAADAPFPVASLDKGQHNQNTATHTVKLAPDDPRYREVVAVPIMEAVDAMPAPIKRALWDLGYVEVYRAWRRGWSAERIRAAAARNGGRLVV